MLQLLQLLQHIFGGGIEGLICRKCTKFFKFVNFTVHFAGLFCGFSGSPGYSCRGMRYWSAAAVVAAWDVKLLR